MLRRGLQTARAQGRPRKIIGGVAALVIAVVCVAFLLVGVWLGVDLLDLLPGVFDMVIVLVLVITLMGLGAYAGKTVVSQLVGEDIDIIEERYRCPGCAYSLRGIARHGLCPECGESFDLDQVERALKKYGLGEEEPNG